MTTNLHKNAKNLIKTCNMSIIIIIRQHYYAVAIDNEKYHFSLPTLIGNPNLSS